MTRPFRQRRRSTLIACLAALALAGCSAEIWTPDIRAHGNLPRADALARIEVGRQTSADVADLLGSPSSRSAFGPETWYYISRSTQPMLFLQPETLHQRVIAISFDAAGRVSGIKQYDKTDARDVALVDRETQTRGSELSFMQQILGNLGRFEDDGS